jgi:hypothetical protein
MKGLSRANSLFKKKKDDKPDRDADNVFQKKYEIDEEPVDDKKKSITINLTLNLTLDKDSLNKALEVLEIYSDSIADDDSSYKKSSEKDWKHYRDYRERDRDKYRY